MLSSSSENFSCKRYYVGETCETYNPCADSPCIKSECIVVNWGIFTLKKNILFLQIGDETEEGRAGEQQQAYQCLCNMEDGIEKCKSAFLSVDWKFIELRIFHTSEYTHFPCARWDLILFFITFFSFHLFPFSAQRCVYEATGNCTDPNPCFHGKCLTCEHEMEEMGIINLCSPEERKRGFR